ncbi:MAG: hypothetical protein BroJett013_30580 [Alphaproteobacteria bacterium]|nr:MAG: hypothetical protein BroJett013_30580 [Alphaproteobacteria bacterium]
MSDVYGIGVWGEPPAAANEAELEQRRFSRPASAGARAEAVIGSAGEWLSFNLLGEALQRQARSTDWNDVILGLPAQQRLVDPDVLNERYGIEGVLAFDAPTSESWAAHRYERARRELARQDVIARAEGGNAATDFGLSLMVGLVDPVNIIFPFGRLNSLRAAAPGLAAWEAGEALAPRMLARGMFGAAEGAVFSTAFEPAFYGLAAATERDYGLQDSLINVLAGAGVGGVINAGVSVFDRPSVAADRARLPQEVRAASPEARASAALAAVQAVGEGRPVEAARIYQASAEARAAELARFSAAAEPIRFAPVKAAEVFTPAGGRERAQYAIVEIDDVIASHTDELNVDPRYPAALQPRDRTRAASAAQLAQFGAPFEPARWGETFQGDAGAPVIGSDGAVESGNARTIWMRRAYRGGDPRADAYRQWLAEQGYPVDGFERPLLARITEAARDPARRIAFAEELNKPASAAMSATELAFADARRIDAGLLDAVGGEPQAFQRQALQRLTSEAERAALIDATGQLAQAGERRIEAALMAKAYDDPALIETRFETTDADLKTVSRALSDAAPAMARLAARIDAGEISAEFDVRPALQAANAVLRAARRQGKSVKAFLAELAGQGDMFDAGLHPRTVDALSLLTNNGGRARARAKIAAALETFAKAVEASPAPVMFDEARIDYGRAFEAAGRATGEPALRASDGGGAQDGGRGADQAGEGLAERVRDGRDRLAAELERQLEPRFGGDDAAAIARVAANGFASIGAHYGETADDVARAIGLRIEDAAAAAGDGRRFGQALRSPEQRARWIEANVRQRSDKGADYYTYDVDGALAVVRIGRDGLIDISYDGEIGAPGAGAEAVKVFTNAFNIIAHDMETKKRPRYKFAATREELADMYARMLARVVEYRIERPDPLLFHLTRKREGQIRAERRALKREQRAADKGVLQAERQAAAFLAAADCFAREGFSDAGGRGASELLAGLALGQAAAIPAGVAVSQAAAHNVSPAAFSEEWLRRAREMGRRLEFPRSPPPPDAEQATFGGRVWRVDDDPDWSAPGRNAWDAPADGAAFDAWEAARAAGARTPPAPPSFKRKQPAAADADAGALIDAFEPIVDYMLEEREDLETEALMEAFEPLLAAERRRARREARR